MFYMLFSKLIFFPFPHSSLFRNWYSASTILLLFNIYLVSLTPQQSPMRPGTLTRATQHLLAVPQKGWQGKAVITLLIFIPSLSLCCVTSNQEAPLNTTQSETHSSGSQRRAFLGPTGHIFLTAKRLIAKCPVVLNLWFLFWAGLTMAHNYYLSRNKYHSSLFFLSPLPPIPSCLLPSEFSPS